MATVIEKYKKKRTQLRKALTKSITDFKGALDAKSDEVDAFYSILEDKATRLFDLDQTIADSLLQDSDITEEQFIADSNGVEEYREQYFKAISGYRKSDSQTGRKIQLEKFDGDIKQWLTFWSMFKQIHEDESLSEEDKFQYLRQCMVTGSKAKDLVDSFPTTKENYQIAVQELKSRFAEDSCLIEVYVRELLSLVLKQVNSTKKVHFVDLYNKLETQLRALQVLGVTDDKYSYILYPLVESAIPTDILKAWERHKINLVTSAPDNQSRLKALLLFLKGEVEGEERIGLAQSSFHINKTDENSKLKIKKEITNEIPTASSLIVSVCIFCSKNHNSNDCFKTLKTSLSDKKEMIKKSGFCFVCLKGKHQTKLCRTFVQCLLCYRKHYTLMCPDLPAHKSGEMETRSTETLTCNNDQVLIYLQTLVVDVKIGNKVKKVRVLIDTGSMRSYITNKLASDLKLVSYGHSTLKHSLFGGVESKETHNQFKLTLHNSKNNNEVKINVLGQPTICNFVPTFNDETIFNELKQRNIILSDFNYNMSIDILLGTDFIPMILTGRTCNIRKELCCMETILGWTIMGNHVVNSMLNTTISNVCLKNSTVECTFWDLESIGIKDPSQELDTKHHESVMNNFLETVKINNEGRYSVSLPWSTQFDKPTSNYNVAKARLDSVTKRLLHSNRFIDYHKELISWWAQGIIEKVERTDINEGHFLPHRPVFKNVSRTTKIRPVFDASAKDINGNCLNKCLEIGPNLLELVPSLLIKFRLGQIGLSADIRKAFLMINLNEPDRNFLKFLWWSDDTRSEIQAYRHSRVVFGVSSSPFLLNATINYHLNTVMTNPSLKETAEKLSKSFYVDNCISSVNKPDEYNKFMPASVDIMNKGKFQLREWSHTELPNVRFQCCQSKQCVNSSGVSRVSLLGVQWDCVKDSLSCQLNNIKLKYQGSVSKRTILSLYQKFYDPLGILSAVLLTPKLILQECWKLNLNWDERVPDHLASEFVSWLEQFNVSKGLEVPRCILLESPIVDISLHTFADASKVAYGAVIFLRCQVGEVVSVKLVLAKSRVCPTKRVTIPRLELIAATIGV